MAQAAPPPVGPPRFGNLIRSLAIGIGLAYVATVVLLRAGFSLPVALALSSIFPLADSLYEFVKRRHIGAVDVLSLIGIVLGVGLSLWRNDPRFALAKESFVTATIGLIFLLTTLRGRPAIFYLARETTDTPQLFEARWRDMPKFRTLMRRMTWLWGGGLLLEAMLRVAAAMRLPPTTTLGLSPAIAAVTFATLIWVTMRWARLAQARATAASVLETGR